MYKKEFIREVARKSGLSHKEVAEAIKAFLEVIKEEVRGGGEVQFIEFGKFYKKFYNERVGHNPQTGEEITIPAHHVLKFKPAERLRCELFK